MSKKSKKTKTPKPPKAGGGKGGGRDPITGIALELQGIGAIQSDKVYDSRSEQVKRLKDVGGGAIADGLTYELEYNANAIVMNSITSREAGSYYNRNIFFGKFLPSSNGETRFAVEIYYRGGFYPWDTWDDASRQRIPSTYEHVTRIQATNFILSTNLLKSYSDFPRSETILFSTEPVTDLDTGWTSSQSRNAIPGEVAQFFQTGWHNPEIFFSSNLI